MIAKRPVGPRKTKAGLTVVLGLIAGSVAGSVVALPRVAGPLGKVDSNVRALAGLAGGGPQEVRRFAETSGLGFRGDGVPRVRVAIETAAMAAGQQSALEAAGVEVIATADTTASAWVPLARLAEVAALPQVLAIRRPVRPVWSQEGVDLIGGTAAHARGFRGQGVRIGVIDTFQGYQTHVGRELPPSERVTFRSFLDGGGAGDSNHGVEVASILTDMAPDASLYLAAIEDDVGYRNAVDWLIAQGVSVINHSGGFGLFGDLKGNGPVNFKVGEAFANGVLYVEAAGNEAQSHWEGTFRDANRNGFAEFAPGRERIPFRVPEGDSADLRIDLQWDDWGPNPVDPRPTADYDLCLYDAGGSAISCSTEAQSGDPGQAAYEVVVTTRTAPGMYSIGVRKLSGPDLHFEVTLDPNYSFGDLDMPQSSLIVPADHPDAFTVGATNLSDLLEPFSSRGPTNDGRLKPDLTGPDGVSTFGGVFFGTSAATPHVAGAAALLLSANPALDAASLRDTLRASAHQVPSDTVPGPDTSFGYGRLQLDLGGAPTPVPTVRPPGGSGGGGGGCRIVKGAAGDDGLTLLAAALAVLAYAGWLSRRGA